MASIIADEAYKDALWTHTRNPFLYPVNTREMIIIAHNKAVGMLKAVQERELKIVTDINEKLVRDERELREANELLLSKLRKQSELLAKQRGLIEIK